MDIPITEDEMVKLIGMAGNAPMKFKFGTGGSAISSDDECEVRCLQAVRDEVELDDHHRVFML